MRWVIQSHFIYTWRSPLSTCHNSIGPFFPCNYAVSILSPSYMVRDEWLCVRDVSSCNDPLIPSPHLYSISYLLSFHLLDNNMSQASQMVFQSFDKESFSIGAHEQIVAQGQAVFFSPESVIPRFSFWMMYNPSSIQEIHLESDITLQTLNLLMQVLKTKSSFSWSRCSWDVYFKRCTTFHLFFLSIFLNPFFIIWC